MKKVSIFQYFWIMPGKGNIESKEDPTLTFLGTLRYIVQQERIRTHSLRGPQGIQVLRQ